MIWSDNILSSIHERISEGNTTWAQASQELTELHQEYISAEAARSAVRRWRNRAKLPVVPKPIEIVEDIKYKRNNPINKEPPITTVVFGAIGDTHLCSNYSRLDILESLYDIFHSLGVNTVYHTGNYVDGEAPFNTNEIHAHGIDGQARYFVENYPQRPGITTYYVDGDDHEGEI